MLKSVPVSERGRIKYSVVLRLVQLACSEVHSGAQNIKDNERVGFYVNEDGKH